MNGHRESTRKKLCFIFGTRPEAIKLAPVILRARDDDRFDVRVTVTGQHREMLDQMLSFFGIQPDVDLAVMEPNQSLASLTARVIQGVDVSLRQNKPDWVIVQGDTTTVWAAAISAFFNQVPVAHVEAGLRTHDKYQPFPEEINRRLAGRVADLHFAPTSWAQGNLSNENVPSERVHVTGNTVIDALQWTIKRNHESPPAETEQIVAWMDEHVGENPMVLITGHRRESFGEGFQNICESIEQLARLYLDVQWVYPVHLNPNVQGPVHAMLGDCENVHLLEPQAYPAFVALMERCRFALTDSGGVQEEAPSLGKPVLIMRSTTERPEGVEAGASKLIGTDSESIVSHCAELLDASVCRCTCISPYGDGRASERILDVLAETCITVDSQAAMLAAK